MSNHKLGDLNKCECGSKATAHKWITDRWVALCMSCRLKLTDTEGNVAK